MENKGNTLIKILLSKQFRMVAGFAGLAIFVVILFAGWLRSSDSTQIENSGGIFDVHRDDMIISVTENGNVKALNSLDIKSEVEGRTTIIKIIDEGTYISPQDVNEGKILVELDSSKLVDRLSQKEIAFASAEAAYIEAKESYDIRKNQNDSDIKGDELDLQFSLMDLEEYLGALVATQICSDPNNGQSMNPDIAGLVTDPHLGGSALQRLRKLEADIDLAQEKLQRASNKLDWTQKLHDQKYVATTELEADKLEVKRLGIQQEQAKTARELFILYEFPKRSQALLSNHFEAKRKLNRTMAKARSLLAQAGAKLKGNEAKYELQKNELEKIQTQLEACQIKAPATGLVVYASSMDFWRSRHRPIEEGAEIRERQKIISIPDTSQMAIDIQVHETWVDKIKPNQQAIITLDAFPDETLTGHVIKVAPLPSPQISWMDTGLKVYSTEIVIEGHHEFLRPGMSAKVEIIIEELNDIISVPVQAVANKAGRKICYVATNNGGSKPREVQVGAFNNSFIHIVDGLEEGEKVLLTLPRIIEMEEGEEAEEKKHNSE